MRFATLCVVLVALGLAGASLATAEGELTNKVVENVLMQFIQDLSKSMSGAGVAKRRLLSGEGTEEEDVHGFFHTMLGEDWSEALPESWSQRSFDWSHLGQFEYSSNLGDFLQEHDLEDMTAISGPKDVMDKVEAIENAFCKPESYKPGTIKPTNCTGPTVKIALVPKKCVLEGETKQVACYPAKLVLTKTPGSCTHKYKSASKWTGKECKISGGVGMSKKDSIGGDEKLVPLKLHAGEAELEFQVQSQPVPAPAPTLAPTPAPTPAPGPGPQPAR